MKYVILCLTMLVCFAIGGASAPAASRATSLPPAPAAPAPIVDIVDEDGDAALDCGGNICTKGTYCCNASCGRCVPKGMLCTQEAC